MSISKCYVFVSYKDNPKQSPCIYLENMKSAVQLYQNLIDSGEHQNHKLDYLTCGYEFCTDQGRTGVRDITSYAFS
ncbi:MAG: hypothetical protein E6713_06765 [Sporomusaceae bacterium]|nr:hypothetical protein [Sporomusaceae bacterium]